MSRQLIWFVVRRLAALVLLLALVSFVVFSLTFLAPGDPVDAYLFDEVDAGIGGAVAEIVGRQLRALGERAQVLCVTHLAQVAAQAHHQLRVTKWSDGKMARTAVHALSASERVNEIARMLGGVEITEQARAHALEMLNRSSAPPARGKRRAPSARR